MALLSLSSLSLILTEAIVGTLWMADLMRTNLGTRVVNGIGIATWEQDHDARTGCQLKDGSMGMGA